MRFIIASLCIYNHLKDDISKIPSLIVGWGCVYTNLFAG